MKKNILLLFLLLSSYAIVQAQTNQCSGALDICGNQAYSALNDGEGSSDECLGSSTGNCGCFVTEHNSVWFRLVVQTAGDFRFEINPLGAADYDWAVWNQGNGGSCPTSSQLASPTSCNFDSGNDQYTGISSDGNEPTAYAGTNADWESDFSVAAGDVIYLLVDNFSSGSTVGFELNFFLSDGGTNSNATAAFDCALTNTCTTCADADCNIYLYTQPADTVIGYTDATADGACTNPNDVNAQTHTVCGTFPVPTGYTGPGVTLPLIGSVEATSPEVPADCNAGLTYTRTFYPSGCGTPISPISGTGSNAIYPVTAGATYHYCGTVTLATGSIPSSCRIGTLCLTPELQLVGLPIALTEFTGEHINTVNHLKWKTSNESNNNFFEVERSADGANFATLGRVLAHGTTSETHAYTFDDVKPFAGKNYYRLKQVDFNGEIHYTQTIIIEVKRNGGGLFIQPNPATSVINYNFFVNEASIATIQVLDVNGKIIITNKKNVTEGENIFDMDIQSLPKGVYILQIVETSGTSQTQRFIKE